MTRRSSDRRRHHAPAMSLLFLHLPCTTTARRRPITYTPPCFHPSATSLLSLRLRSTRPSCHPYSGTACTHVHSPSLQHNTPKPTPRHLPPAWWRIHKPYPDHRAHGLLSSPALESIDQRRLSCVSGRRDPQPPGQVTETKRFFGCQLCPLARCSRNGSPLPFHLLEREERRREETKTSLGGMLFTQRGCRRRARRVQTR